MHLLEFTILAITNFSAYAPCSKIEFISRSGHAEDLKPVLIAYYLLQL